MSVDVTILTPCYNHAALLPEAVASVARQEAWDAGRTIEMIVVNDGSTDGGGVVAAELARQHAWLQVISGPRQGQARARQQGFAGARGRYLVLLDADDLLAPGMVHDAISLLDTHPEWSAVAGTAWLVGNDGKTRLRPLQPRPRDWPEVLEFNPLGALAACMVRSELVRELGGLAVDGPPGCEDWDLWVRLARCQREVGVSADAWASYRQHAGNFSRRALAMLEAELALLNRASRHDPRLPASQFEPITGLEKDRLQNGRVFHALGLLLSQDAASGELEKITSHLLPTGFDASFCSQLAQWGVNFGLETGGGASQTLPHDQQPALEQLRLNLRARGWEAPVIEDCLQILSRALAGPARRNLWHRFFRR